MPNRPKIPAEVVREIMLECGHRCSICGIPYPVELAHIIPWRNSNEHKVEDLICLCANCHKLADQGKWTQKTLRRFKKEPWVVRQYKNADNIDRPTSEVELSINLELADVDEKNKRWLKYALAAFLDIPPRDVRITSVKEGNSVTVTVELPSESAVELLNAYERQDGRLVKYLDAITLFNLYGSLADRTKAEHNRQPVLPAPKMVSPLEQKEARGMFVINYSTKLHTVSHIIWDIDGVITGEDGSLSHEVAAKIICLGSQGIFHSFITGRDADWLIENIVTPMKSFSTFAEVRQNLTFYGEAGSVIVDIVNGEVTARVHPQAEVHPLATNKDGIRDLLRELVYDPKKLKAYKRKRIGPREKVIYDANQRGWIVNIDKNEPPLHPYIWSTSKKVFATLEKIRDEEGKIQVFDQIPFVQIVNRMIRESGLEEFIEVAPADTAIDIVPKANGLRLGKSWAAGRALQHIQEDILGSIPLLDSVIDATIAFGDSEADLDFTVPLFPKNIQRRLQHNTLQIVFVGDEHGLPSPGHQRAKYTDHIIIQGTGAGDLAFDWPKNLIHLHAAKGARVVSAVLDFLKQWDYFKPFAP